MAREAHMAKEKPIEYRTGFMVSPENEWCARGRTRVGLILGGNPNDSDRSLIQHLIVGMD